MLISESPLRGAWVLDPERVEDERGFVARVWNVEELAARGLALSVTEALVAWNRLAGTLRGMHYQAAPHGQVKLIRCTAGAAFDVIVDLRPESPTFQSWYSVELSARNGRALYVPEGCAHGYETLEDGTEVAYELSGEYRPEHARGVRWNDPTFAILWPQKPAVVNERDSSYPDFASPFS